MRTSTKRGGAARVRAAGSEGRKRRYVPPAVVESAKFETLALGCGFNDPKLKSCAGSLSN